MKFKDCEFNFYTAHYGSWANDKRIVFRVRNNKFPQNRAEEKRIENYDRIIPATESEIAEWFKSHPDYQILM